MGCSVVCMVRSGGYSVRLLDSYYFFSFLLAFGGVGELSVNKYGVLWVSVWCVIMYFFT